MPNRANQDELARVSSLMSQQSSQPTEVSLFEVMIIIWKAKLVLVAFVSFFTITAIFYALNKQDIYKSQVTLAPSYDQAGGGISNVARQFGGLASLAGINLGSSSATDKKVLAIEVLKSRKFLTEFIRRHNIKVPLLAAKGWDKASSKLLIDSDRYDEKAGSWVSKNGKIIEPSDWEAYLTFKSLLNVSESVDTGMVSLSLEYYSPDYAVRWLDLIVQDINSVMKQKDVLEAKRSIEYLRVQLAKTAVTDMQSVFYQLIEEQTKTIMLTEVRDEYIFSVVDPAYVPEEKERPKRFLIVVTAALFGGFVGLIVTLLINRLQMIK